MGRYICKIKDLYCEWSTIVDAPVTYGMTLDQLKEYIKEEYGNEGLGELPERLARVEATGTSARGGYTLKDIVSGNRAGPKERHLTMDQLYEFLKYPKDDTQETQND